MTAMIPTTNSPTTNSATGGSAALANLIHVTADTPVVAINFYVASGVTPPDRVYVWNVDTGNLLQSLAIVDTPVTGWNQRAIDPFTLVAGTHYAVGFGRGADWAVTYWSSSPPALSSPYVFDSCKIVTPDGVSPAVPTGASSAALLGVGFDDNISGGNGGGTGSTNVGDPTYTGDLQAWLSAESDKNLHKTDGLPWLTYQEVTDGDTGLAAIAANVGAIMGASWSSAADTLHQIGSKVASILTTVTDGPLPGIAGLEELANTILDTLEGAAQFLINPTGGGAGALANNPPLPGTGWAMVGEADFDDCDVITVQCHLIVLDFGAFPVSRPAHNVCGVPIRYRLGWWCPMNGDFAGARQFIDFEKMHVQDGGRLMNGALIVCEPGTSGHWQAWLLS